MSTLRTARVLIVDDDHDTVRLVATALRKDGHEVVEASSGIEGLTRVHAMLGAGLDPPDVVVTDGRMPHGDGHALVAGLRAVGCNAPVVVMSGHGDAYARKDVAAFIPKPFEINEVRALVRWLTIASASVRHA